MPVIVDLAPYSPSSREDTFSGFTEPDVQGRVKADTVGAIVVTPEPINGAGALRTWNFKAIPWWTDDQHFIAGLLDDLQATACTDVSKVLLMGFAVGGVFGSILACDQAQRFAALVTVSGLYSPAGCRPAKPLPVLSFHGTADRFLPFGGGIGPGAGDLGLSNETAGGMLFVAARAGAVESSQAWADHDRCTTGPVSINIAPGITRDTWSDCASGGTVELYVLAGGSHTWPGSIGMTAYERLLGPVSHNLIANDVIWNFFTRATR